MSSPDPYSLYLHVPFCRHRCSYCDFNTYTSLGDMKSAYAAALAREIREVAGKARLPVRSVYLGGGTPSLMSPSSMGQILTAVRQSFRLMPNVEITMEANPDTVDSAYLAAVHELGINRLSYGAQSADHDELQLLQREHSYDAVIQAVNLSRKEGFENLNLDLIYGLPGQSLVSWEKTIGAALALYPDHLSLYCLTIEPGTPMHRWLNNGRIESPDGDLAADQYELACELLASHGFVHYEISNWALPGRECRHNLAYWRNEEYLGMGAGAHGHAAGYRYSVVKQPRVYIRRIQNEKDGRFPWSSAVAMKHRLTHREAMSDTVIMQLRLLQEGIDLKAFSARVGYDLREAFPGTVEKLIDLTLLRAEEDRLLLTRQGRFLSNQVFYHFI